MHISYQTLRVRDHQWSVARHSFAEKFVGVVLLNIQYEIVHEHVPYTNFFHLPLVRPLHQNLSHMKILFPESTLTASTLLNHSHLQ